MANNEILRSIRNALNIDDASMIQIFRDSGREVGQTTSHGVCPACFEEQMKLIKK